jgi:hypothetical protein
MNVHHTELAAGRWKEMSLCEQMANVGSEVSRALNWRKKGKAEYVERAVVRALELMELTIASVSTFPRRRELTRVREVLLDFFCGNNDFASSEKTWRGYFDHFAYALH